MTVLLIDDDDDALTLLQMMLRRKGVTTRTARSLAEAREVLAEADGNIKVIVTDLELGDGDGMALHPEVVGRVSRFVVLTGRSSVTAPAEVVVLQKPVDVAPLLAAIGHGPDG